MRIVSHRKIRDFYTLEGHGDSRVALENWYHTVQSAEWHDFADVKADFATADYVGNQHYVFNIKGNAYRLVVVVKFIMGCVFVRFVGTHAEYDRIDASKI